MWPGQSASATNRRKPQVRFSCDESQKLQIGSDTLILTGSAACRQILLPRWSNHLSSVFFLFSRRGHPFINIVSGLPSKTDHWNTSCAYGWLPVLKYEKTKHAFERLVYRTGNGTFWKEVELQPPFALVMFDLTCHLPINIFCMD